MNNFKENNQEDFWLEVLCVFILLKEKITLKTVYFSTCLMCDIKKYSNIFAPIFWVFLCPGIYKIGWKSDLFFLGVIIFPSRRGKAFLSAVGYIIFATQKGLDNYSHADVLEAIGVYYCGVSMRKYERKPERHRKIESLIYRVVTIILAGEKVSGEKFFWIY